MRRPDVPRLERLRRAALRREVLEQLDHVAVARDAQVRLVTCASG